MHHKILETKAVVTDRGEFTAIAAAYTMDRVKDQIMRGAFEKTIADWQGSGKSIPLHYDHRGDPEYIIGSVDPATMREVEEGLHVGGHIDLEDSDVARQAWRSMKKNRMGLSFGYLPTKAVKKGAVNELHVIDIFEITVTPHPIHPDTRFLSLKADTQTSPPEAVDDEPSDEPDEAKPRSQDPLKNEIDRLLIDLALGH